MCAKRALLAGCAALVPFSVSIPVLAHAQTAGAQAGDGGSTVKEVVITAQRRQERAVNVPISITSISGQQLAASGIRRSYDLTEVVPGLRIDQDGPNVQPTLRGIGNAIASPGVNPGVATYIDGYYQPSQLSTNFDFVGITSVDVLKGPQGTLFGRNATGGAILVTTRQPSFEPHVEALVGYGRYNDYRAQLYASRGITDSLAVNIAASFHRGDGFSKDVVTGKNSGTIDKWTVRGKVLYKPSDDFSALLTLERSQGEDDSAVAFDSFHGLNNVATLLPALGFAVPPGGVIAPSTRGLTAASGPPSRFFGWNDKAQLTLTKKFSDFATLTSYTQYQKENYTFDIDFDGTQVPLYRAVLPNPILTFSQEVDLTSNRPGKLQWVTGFFYYWNHNVNTPYNQTGLLIDGTGAVPVNAFYSAVVTTAYAGFADATYEVVPDLYLTFGGRYSIEEQIGLAQQNPQGIPATVPAALGGGSPPGAAERDTQNFHSFTPRVVLRYNFAPSANVFFSYSQGFKSGGYSPTDFSTAPKIANFQPEDVDAYEVGLKTNLARVRIESSVYYNAYDNQQVAYYTAGVGHIANAASSQIYGAELSVTGQITDELTVGINGAWTHGRYLKFPNASQSLLSGTFSVNVSGEPMERVPEWTGTLFANYQHPIAGGMLALNGSLYLTSKFRLDPTGVYEQGGYGLLNARASYTFPDRRTSIAAFGDNITDTKYTSSILPFTPFAILQQWGNPAEWGIEIAYKY